ncbi:MAG: MoaD/ThiS family protein [Bdellovibrio sp.]|nr:MoaD/ThiS family protein [Bdellovibrio sp.]
MAKMILAPAFQKITQGEKWVKVESSTLIEAIHELDQKYPGIKSKIVGDAGQILNYVSIFLGKEDVRYLQGLKTKLEPLDEVSILVAIAGG